MGAVQQAAASMGSYASLCKTNHVHSYEDTISKVRGSLKQEDHSGLYMNNFICKQEL
jgi:hypothetical protein